MIDLGINVIRTTGENNTVRAEFFHFRQNSCAFCAYIKLCLLLFFPCGRSGFTHLFFGNVPFLTTELHKSVGCNLFRGKSHKWTHQANVSFCNRLDVVFQIFRIGNDDGTVVVILCRFDLLMLVVDTGMENGLNALIDKPLHVTVGKLGGIAFGFGRNGVHTKLVKLSVRPR